MWPEAGTLSLHYRWSTRDASDSILEYRYLFILFIRRLKIFNRYCLFDANQNNVSVIIFVLNILIYGMYIRCTMNDMKNMWSLISGWSVLINNWSIVDQQLISGWLNNGQWLISGWTTDNGWSVVEQWTMVDQWLISGWLNNGQWLISGWTTDNHYGWSVVEQWTMVDLWLISGWLNNGQWLISGWTTDNHYGWSVVEQWTMVDLWLISGWLNNGQCMVDKWFGCNLELDCIPVCIAVPINGAISHGCTLPP